MRSPLRYGIDESILRWRQALRTEDNLIATLIHAIRRSLQYQDDVEGFVASRPSEASSFHDLALR
jgi:hypothetical protein